MDQSNIVLIGMPGSGKSTLGQQLSKSLRMPYLDTDTLIIQLENRALQDIIDNEGLKTFFLMEEKTILQLDVKNHIIATGGSVIHSRAAIEHLKADGVLVYLQLTYPEVKKRIRNLVTRGIAKSRNQSLFDLYEEREPLYRKYADVIIDCSGKRMDTIVQEILDVLKK